MKKFEFRSLKVVALESKTHADVRRVLEKLSILLGMNDVQRLWRVIDADILTAAWSLPSAAHSRHKLATNTPS